MNDDIECDKQEEKKAYLNQRYFKNIDASSYLTHLNLIVIVFSFQKVIRDKRRTVVPIIIIIIIINYYSVTVIWIFKMLLLLFFN